MANKEMTAGQATAEIKKDTIDTPALEKRSLTAPILTVDSDRAVETQENVEGTIWYGLQNAYRTRKILTGQPGDIGRMKGGGTTVIVCYKRFRVAIPLTEMMIHLPEDESHNYGELSQRQDKILGNMLGYEIDFIIRGLDNNSRNLVASRKDAMLKRRQIFYLPDTNGSSHVCVGRVVQARVAAVVEKVVRVEIFGVETFILTRDLSWGWLDNVNEMFHVGDQILVRTLSITTDNLERVSAHTDVKNVNGDTSKVNLNKYKIQGRYTRTVTGIHKGAVFIRLSIGINAIVHSYYDSRTPGEKDEISFVVTRIDGDRNVAVRLISRVIRQNI